MLSFKEFKQQKQLIESVEINPIKALEEVILDRHPEVEKLHLQPRDRHDIKLDTLIIKKEHRNKGVGSKVLHDLKTYADKHGKRIILTAGVRDKHWGTTSQSRLDKFYKRNGFVANKGRNKDFTIMATHYYAGRGHISESIDHPMIEVDGAMKHRHNSLGQPIHPTEEGIRNFHRWFGNSQAVDEHGRPLVVYHGTSRTTIDEFKKSALGVNTKAKSAYGGFFFTNSTQNANEYAGGSATRTKNMSTKDIKASWSEDDIQEYKRLEAHRDSLKPPRTRYDNWMLTDEWRERNKKVSDFMDATIEKNAAGHHIIPVYLSITKPLIHDMKNDEYRDVSYMDLINQAKKKRKNGLVIKNTYDPKFGDVHVAFNSNQIKSAIGNNGNFSSTSNKITESEHPMIEVDGEMRHRNNSEGKPIHPTDEGIRNFHRWAGGNEIKDSEGRPMVLYHGTSKDTDFAGFKIPKNGAWLTANRDVASDYAKQNDSMDLKYEGGKYIDVNTASRVMPVYLKSQSTYNMTKDDFDAINKENYKKAQGVHFDRLRASGHDVAHLGGGVYAVIGNSGQIKSAIGNSGKFAHKTKLNESVDHPMIDVDGEMKHRHNSLGQPIHPTDEGIRNFHRWFGDSHVVDEHGRPLVVYHGSPFYGFDEFDVNKSGQRDRGDFGKGIYFTPSKDYAATYEKHGLFNSSGDGNKTYAVYLSMKTPLKHSARKGSPHEGDLYEKDGIITYTDKYYELPFGHPKNISEIVAFNSGQIKSATGNSGAFSHPSKITESQDYMGSHTAPTEDDAPAHDLTKIMPDDVYSPDASRYYSTGFSDSEDRNVFAKLHSIRNKPSASITIYRAIPKSETRDSAIAKLEKHKAGILKTGRFPSGVDASKFKNPSEYYDWAYDEVNRLKELPQEENIKKTINKGDWVTLSRAYAKEHGDAHLGGQYRILSKSVRADEVFTNGDSIHEWGYHPK